MLGWSVGFFIAALVAALFGFGAVASAFTGIAMILFWVFVVLFVLSLVFGLVQGASGAAHAGGGGGVGLLVGAVALGVLTYAWIDNHWTAEKVGRSIDHAAGAITADAGDAVHQVRTNAAESLDETQHAVEPPAENTDTTRH